MVTHMKLLFVLGLLYISTVGFGQDSSTMKRTATSGKNVRLMYEQPVAKDSPVFGGVIPFGKVWSAGGGNSTHITFEKDGNFGGLPVKAGTYTMLVIPEKKEWTIILNSAVKDGVFNYEQLKDKDVVKIMVPTKTISNKADHLTYRFSDTQMIVEWEHTQVVVPITF